MDDGIDLHVHAGAFQHGQALGLDAVADVLLVAELRGQHLVGLVQNQDCVIAGAEDGGAEQVLTAWVPL